MRKLLKLEERTDMCANLHGIEGTKLRVLEILMVGFAYSSHFLLLRSRSTVDKLNDEKIRHEICNYPYRFGKKLEFGHGLEMGQDDTIYYVGPVARKDLLQEG